MPEISRWHMHPFSVADCSGSRLTLHVKRYGAFTKVGLLLWKAGCWWLQGMAASIVCCNWQQQVYMNAQRLTHAAAATQHPPPKSLLEGLRDRSITAVRVVGPHGACDATLGCQLSPPDSWLRYNSLLLIGGGVGVSRKLGRWLSQCGLGEAPQWQCHSGAPAKMQP